MHFPQSQWLDLLNELDYRKTRIYEIIPLDASLNENFEKIYKELDEAAKSFSLGDYNAMLTHCRRAIDELNNIYPLKCDDNPENCLKNVIKNRIGSDSKSKIINGILGDIRAFTNKGPHIGSIISRYDAEFCLEITLSVFKIIGNILQIKE